MICGQPLVRSFGRPPIDGCVLIAFPSVEAAKAWYHSPAYTEARAHRFLGSDYRCFITEGI